MNEIMNYLSQSYSTIATIVVVINIILHIIFASGVARDVGNLNRQSISTQLIPGVAWVFATLIGGVLVLALYWLVHHSSLSHH